MLDIQKNSEKAMDHDVRGLLLNPTDHVELRVFSLDAENNISLSSGTFPKVTTTGRLNISFSDPMPSLQPNIFLVIA